MSRRRPDPAAKAKAIVMQCQARAVAICAAALAALDAPLADGSWGAVLAFDRIFNPNGDACPEAMPLGAVWDARKAEAEASWGAGKRAPECEGPPDRRDDHPASKCGLPVRKGHALCWDCEIRAAKLAVEAARDGIRPDAA